MRIAIASQNCLQPNNGQAAFVRHLAAGLAHNGHETLVLTPSDRRRPYCTTLEGARIETIRSISLAPFYPDVFVTPRAARAVTRSLGTYSPDLVHVQDHFPLGAAAARVAHGHGLPLVATNHFLPENIVPSVPVLSRWAWSRARLERLLWRMVMDTFCLADAVTAPSRTAADILRRAGIGKPVRAISCGIDLERFGPLPDLDRAAVRTRHGLSPGRTLFLYVGRTDPEKRLEVLLHALAHPESDGAQLGVAGRGHDLARLAKLAGELGLGERARFLGFVEDRDLPALLQLADAFAMPSEAELLSIATLEAMASGLPVLAANARALPELVEHMVTGCLFRAGDPADAARWIGWLVSHPAERARMGAVGREKAATHALGETIRAYERLYAEVFAARRS